MYKLHLILKYLLKRRIAWVSLIAVMLCTTMVVVVRSVMGGWLEMFRESFHGLTGDIVIEGNTLSGFPHYQEIVDRVEQLPEVEAAVPTIYTYGLINIANLKSSGVQVIGYDIEKISRVHNFREGLHLQHKSLLEEADQPGTPPLRAQLLRAMAELPPTFDLKTYVRVPLDALPAGMEIPQGEAERFTYDAGRRWLVFRGVMEPDERDRWLAASTDPLFQEAVRLLYDKTAERVIDYEDLNVKSRTGVTTWPGLIAGVGVLNIKKNKEGETVNRHRGLYELPVKLTVMGMEAGASISDFGKAEEYFWVVDDSRTGVWQFDSNTVYVPFDVLQQALRMQQKTTGRDKVTNQPVVEPARATDIHVKVKPGVELADAKAKIAVIVGEVFDAHREELARVGADPTVETWEEDKATFINAIENETVLMTFLFGIISLVAVFLIFCIFYMIVVEKTKDIGIIKSVGATAGGVAGIFLGYGLVIGLVGGLMGLALSYGIVRNINEIHQALGNVMGIQIWNPEVYLFDMIPNRMNWRDVGVITVAMMVASVFGALVPAIVAAAKRPVDALRWE
jgi:lipoprotein-releasing system permease protein